LGEATKPLKLTSACPFFFVGEIVHFQVASVFSEIVF
jgi:hypothetical protein